MCADVTRDSMERIVKARQNVMELQVLPVQCVLEEETALNSVPVNANLVTWVTIVKRLHVTVSMLQIQQSAMPTENVWVLISAAAILDIQVLATFLYVLVCLMQTRLFVLGWVLALHLMCVTARIRTLVENIATKQNVMVYWPHLLRCAMEGVGVTFRPIGMADIVNARILIIMEYIVIIQSVEDLLTLVLVLIMGIVQVLISVLVRLDLVESGVKSLHVLVFLQIHPVCVMEMVNVPQRMFVNAKLDTRIQLVVHLHVKEHLQDIEQCVATEESAWPLILVYVHRVILASLVSFQFVLDYQETTHEHVMVMVGVTNQILVPAVSLVVIVANSVN